MFYALATRKIRSQLIQFRHVLEDIESLNRKAMDGVFGLTAISYHAYPYVADKYVLMASGSSIGDNYGPMLVSAIPMSVAELAGKRVAIPGKLTTAYLALRILQPDFEPVVVEFDHVLEAVREKAADAALVIHEAQLTYSKGGFHLIADLGKWFRKTYDLPLPLGANALRRDLSPEIKSECCRLMRESIVYALENHEEALNYALQFARDMDPALADKFIGMYVNKWTLDYGEDGRRAVRELYARGAAIGLVPSSFKAEFLSEAA
jgi:1,4-dihydroxy-6-naphthoate synthase